jgi:molybdate transport system ATP-binding protein
MLKVEIAKKLPDFQLNVKFESDGGIMALFGPSGSGKTLTLHCLAGLLKPDAGCISVGGRVLFDSKSNINLPPRRRQVAYVSQDYALFPHLTAGQNVAYGLDWRQTKENREQVAHFLRLVGLESLGRKYPAELSGGQKQRVALARALITKPSLLLLDEPFSSVDSRVKEVLERELLSLLEARLAVPTLLVTHDLSEAYRLSSRIAVYDSGTVLQYGDKEEVLRSPVSAAAAANLGFGNLAATPAGDEMRVGNG